MEWQDDAFELLALEDEQKRLIHALVKRHCDEQHTFDDIIPGKGKGLIGLLCGRPGCGKTLTAEAVAELCHLPLYVVSAGELGIKPYEVDYRLDDIIELAQMWNMILLLGSKPTARSIARLSFFHCLNWSGSWRIVMACKSTSE